MSQQDADSSASPSSAKPSDEAQAGQSEDTQLEIQPTRPGDRGIPRVAISTRTMWRAVGVVLITLTAIWAVNQARGVVSMLVVSWFFSLALVPGVEHLHRKRGWKRGAAVGLIYVVGLLSIAVLVLVLIPAIQQVAKEVSNNGPQWLNSLDTFIFDNFGVHILSQQTAQDVSANTKDLLTQFSQNIVGKASGIVSSGAGFLFSMLGVATFTFYLTVAFPKLQRSLLSWFSPKAQERLGWTIDQSVVQVGGYLYSRLLLTVINAVGFVITMVLVGIPVGLAIPLAIFGGFVSEFIPQIGTYIGGAVPILLTLLLQGLVQALVVLGYVLVYQAVENYFLSPKISAHTMQINGGLAFGSALVGGALFGAMGAFMALPVAAMIYAFFTNFRKTNEVVYQSKYADDDAPVGPGGTSAATTG